MNRRWPRALQFDRPFILRERRSSRHALSANLPLHQRVMWMLGLEVLAAWTANRMLGLEVLAAWIDHCLLNVP